MYISIYMYDFKVRFLVEGILEGLGLCDVETKREGYVCSL